MSDEPLLLLMFAAFEALRRNGWSDPMHAPFEIEIEMIELVSTGVHRGYREPNTAQRFWVYDGQDTYPCRPILFRRLLA